MFHRGVPYPVTREDALGTIQLLNAFYVANEQAKWVKVAEAGDSKNLGRPDEALANLYRTEAPAPMGEAR